VFVVSRNLHDIPPSNDVDFKVHPLAMVLGRLAGALSTDEMRKLNYEVDGAKRDKKIVVHEWLLKKGFGN